MAELTRQYGRYGDNRVAALQRATGWQDYDKDGDYTGRRGCHFLPRRFDNRSKFSFLQTLLPPSARLFGIANDPSPVRLRRGFS